MKSCFAVAVRAAVGRMPRTALSALSRVWVMRLHPATWLVVSCLLQAVHQAGAATVERTTVGTGKTREEAVWSGLLEAIRQSQGLVVDSQQELDFSLREFGADESTFETRVQKNVREKTRGLIDSYEILALERGGGELWSAHLRVELPEFKPLGLDRSQLRSIAVPPFRVGRELGTASGVGGKLVVKIIAQLTQARKFRVLDREFDPEIGLELARVAGASAEVSQLAKLGRRGSADYLLLGTVTQPGVASNQGQLDFRVIEVALREVRWADAVPLMFESAGNGAEPKMSEAALAAASEEAATLVLDAIYPIKVLAQKQTGEVYLSQGGLRSGMGQLFNVHHAPESVYDPDTGLPIRIEGPVLGRIQVTGSFPKYSVARWIGEATPPAGINLEGFVCRRVPREELQAEYQRALESDLALQEERIAAGECPPLEVLAYRTAAGWSFSVRNRGGKALQLGLVTRVLAGSARPTVLNLVLPPGRREAFGLNEPFSSGDHLELNCDGFKTPFVHLFR
jgi:TolB-like protein